MPNFIIHCSENVLQLTAPSKIMQAVYEAAEATGLFAPNDIKVRIQPFHYYQLADGKNDFLHVFGYIMQGRTTKQKAALSKSIITSLKQMLPNLSFLAMNVSDFEAASYCNQAMIDPLNASGDKHFNL